MVPDDSGIEQVEAICAAEEEGVGDEPGGDAVERVAGAVARGCDGTLEGLSGKPQEEDCLKQNEDEDDRGGTRARPGPMRGDGAPPRGGVQRQERAVERLEGADDPEDDRRRRGREDDQQRAQRRADEINDTALARGGPGGECFGGPDSDIAAFSQRTVARRPRAGQEPFDSCVDQSRPPALPLKGGPFSPRRRCAVGDVVRSLGIEELARWRAHLRPRGRDPAARFAHAQEGIDAQEGIALRRSGRRYAFTYEEGWPCDSDDGRRRCSSRR